MDDPSRNERWWRDLSPEERRRAEEIYEGGLAEVKRWQAEQRERYGLEILAALQSTDGQAPDPYRWDQAAGEWVGDGAEPPPRGHGPGRDSRCLCGRRFPCPITLAWIKSRAGAAWVHRLNPDGTLFADMWAEQAVRRERRHWQGGA